MKLFARPVGVLFIIGHLSACGSARVLNAEKPRGSLIYAGARLDWYAIEGGCCPKDHFGVSPPEYAWLDLPFSALLDTILLPLSLAAELGVNLTITGGN